MRGAERPMPLPARRHRTRRGEQRPESEGISDGAGNRSRVCLNGQRAIGRGNPVRLRGKEQTPEGSTLDVAAG